MFDLSFIEKHDENGNYLGIEFEVVDGQIQFCTGLEMIRQQIRNLLLTWTGQWFLDVTFGIDYSSQIGERRQQLILLEIAGKVSQIPEVSKVLRCQSIIEDEVLIIDLSVLAKNEVLNFKVPPNV